MPIGLGTHMAAGDTFADHVEILLYGDDLRDVALINRKPAVLALLVRERRGRDALPSG